MAVQRGVCLDFLYLFVIAFVSNLIILVNPGFRSHDEWQKLDAIKQAGLLNYIFSYLDLTSAHSLSDHQNPIGYIYQGFASLFMEDAPFVTHLLDVLVHLACAWVLYLILRLYADRSLALLASGLFLMSPATTEAVGWMAASHDRLYVLFIGLAVLSVGYGLAVPQSTRLDGAESYLSYVRSNRSRLLLVFLFCFAAMCSKETAIVAPLVILLLVFSFDRGPTFLDTLKKAAPFFVVSAIAILGYFLFRIDDVINTVTVNSPSRYQLDIANVPFNALVYFGYVFNPVATEAHIVFTARSNWQLVGIAAHLILCVMLFAISPRLVAIYLAGFFLPLLPVLPVSSVGARYLYGSAVALSIAVAYVLLQAVGMWRRKPRRALLQTAMTSGLIGLLIANHLTSQLRLYADGVCQSQMYRSLEDVHRLMPEARTFIIENPSGKNNHVLKRLTHNRDRIGEDFGFQFEISDRPSFLARDKEGGSLRLIMSENCTVLPEPNSRAWPAPAQ